MYSKAKEFKAVTEALKQRITAKRRKTQILQGSNDYTNWYKIIQNKLFRCNQKPLYEEHGGKRRETSDLPQEHDARKFWSELWDKPVQYKEDVEWLVKVKKELEVVKLQNNVQITDEDVIKQVCKIANWKSRILVKKI